VVQVIVDSMAWVTRPDASSKNVLTLETWGSPGLLGVQPQVKVMGDGMFLSTLARPPMQIHPAGHVTTSRLMYTGNLGYPLKFIVAVTLAPVPDTFGTLSS
jgi:hypothetical protein